MAIQAITSFLKDDQDNQVVISYGSYDYGIKTQAEINALTPIVGAKVFNSDTNKIQFCNGVGFIDFALIDDVFVNPYITINANYTTLATDRFIETQTAGITITLLTAVGNTGRVFEIINSSEGSITVNFVEGVSFTLLSNEVLKIASNGTIYKII